MPESPVKPTPPALPATMPVTVRERPALAAPTVWSFQDVDRYALASAACGIVAFVPVVSQVVGIVLGVISLVRIRRARREGRAARGVGWAVTGLVISGVALLSWLFVFVVFGVVAAFFGHVGSALDNLPTAPAG